MPYETTPGTIPHRAVAWLRAQTKATLIHEYSSAQICVGLEIETGGFVNAMRPCVKHGLVKSRHIPGKGKTLWWKLGDGVAELEDEADPLPRRTSAPEVQPRPGEMLPGMHGDEPVVSAGDVPFNACRYIDGSLIVVGVEVRQDGAIILSPKQAQQLWRLAREAA